MLGHRSIDERFVFLNFKGRVIKILFHSIYDTSFGVRNETHCRHKGFEPQQQIRKFGQNKKASRFVSLLICNNNLAGRESDGWHPLVADFILVGQKLEELGFIYNKGAVAIVTTEQYE